MQVPTYLPCVLSLRKRLRCLIGKGASLLDRIAALGAGSKRRARPRTHWTSFCALRGPLFRLATHATRPQELAARHPISTHAPARARSHPRWHTRARLRGRDRVGDDDHPSRRRRRPRGHPGDRAPSRRRTAAIHVNPPAASWAVPTSGSTEVSGTSAHSRSGMVDASASMDSSRHR